MIRLVICWPAISGYMAACCRALAARSEIQLFIIAFRPQQQGASFDDSLVKDLPCRLLDETEREDAALVASLVMAQRPQVVHLPGWLSRVYNLLPYNRSLAAVKFVLGSDTPRQYTLRQQLNRIRLRRHLRRMDRVLVPGERAWQFARFLGVSEHKIRRGAYGIDYTGISGAYQLRMEASDGWPRRFLYVGRYVPVKAIGTLLDAYQYYRAGVSDPWPLDCAGSGPLARLIDDEPGVRNLGFIQPSQQLELWAGHGAFVLPSRFDPWPLVLAEACAAGLPVVCTEACGSAVELVRSHYNGVSVATNDPAALADGLRWVHHHYEQCPRMGACGQQLAAPYSAELWAERWVQMVSGLFAGQPTCAPTPRVGGPTDDRPNRCT